MGNCFGSSQVAIEEKLDYSGGEVASIPCHGSWVQKLEEAKEQHKIVVANFSASWCGPCRNTAPVFVELSVKYPTLIFVTVDVDAMPDLVESLEIRATPTFVFMKGGEAADKLVGANIPDLEKKLEQFGRLDAVPGTASAEPE